MTDNDLSHSERLRRIDEEGARKVVEALERAHPWIPKAAEREQKKIAKWRREQQRKAERDARRSA